MKTCTRAALAAVPFCALVAPAIGGIELGVNLLNNSNAEAGPGGTGQVVPIPGWAATQGFLTVAAYDGTPALLSDADPGPADRGDNYFTGGTADVSVAEQRFNLFPRAAQIDAGLLTFELDGWLGSAAIEDDATLSVTFLDNNLDEISTFSIGTLARGEIELSGLTFFETADFIPTGAREAVVEMTFTRASSGSSYNDGSADNVAFRIIPAPGPAALLGVASAVALRRRR